MNRLASISLAVTILLTPGVGSCKLKQKIFGLKGEGDEPFRYENCAPVEATLPKSTKYITTIFSYITAANPEVFRGDLDPAKFCLSVAEEQSINAGAFVKSRRIEFNAGILLAFKSDEQVAATMSHELAHIVRRHNTIASDMYPLGSRKREEVINILLSKKDLEERRIGLEARRGPLIGQFEEFNATSVSVMNGIESPENREKYRKALADASSCATRVQDQYYQYWMENLRESGSSDPLNNNGGAPFVLIPDWEVGESSIAADIRNNLVEMDRLRSEALSIAEGTSDHDSLTNLKSTMSFIVTETNEIMEEYERKRQIEKRLSGLMKLSGISDEELMNGTERDADDIGQQYFLKAGFSRYGFEDVVSALSGSESSANLFKKCVMDSGYSPTRGIVSHPEHCWRFMYAAGWGSSRQNALEISRLGRDNPRSPVTVAFEDGYTLLDAQAEIRAHFEPASPRSPQPPSLPYPPNRPPSQPNPPSPGYRN